MKSPGIYICKQCGGLAAPPTKEQIKALLLKHGDDLARVAGVLPSTVTKWRRWVGQGPRTTGGALRRKSDDRLREMANKHGHVCFADFWEACQKEGMKAGDFMALTGWSYNQMKRARYRYGLKPLPPRENVRAYGDNRQSLEARCRAKFRQGLVAYAADQVALGRTRSEIAFSLDSGPDAVTRALKRQGAQDVFPLNSPQQREKARATARRLPGPKADHPWRK